LLVDSSCKLRPLSYYAFLGGSCGRGPAPSLLPLCGWALSRPGVVGRPAGVAGSAYRRTGWGRDDACTTCLVFGRAATWCLEPWLDAALVWRRAVGEAFAGCGGGGGG